MNRIKKTITILIILMLLHITIVISTVHASFIDNILKMREKLSVNDSKMTFSETKYIKVPDLEEIKIYSEENKRITVQANLSITNPTKENVDKFYYNQLTSDIARKIYNVLVETATNTATIDLNVKYNISENSLVVADECFKKEIEPYIYDALYAYAEDSGSYWWQGSIPKLEYNYTREVNNKVATFGKVILKSNLTQYSDYTAFNNKLEQVCNSINGKDVYEIANSINTYICENVQYAYKADGYTPETGGINQTAYGALMNGKCVCEGFAQLYNLMCRKKGLISICVYGYSVHTDGTKVGHAWNYVYEPSKEQWYAVDCSMNNNNDNTFDCNSYLMIGQNTIIDSNAFNTTHIPELKICSQQTFTPSVPVLSLDGYARQLKLKGDVNGDGKVDVKDIMIINKHRLNKSKLTNEYYTAGDVNKDGKVDIKDILQINKYRLGKISEF